MALHHNRKSTFKQTFGPFIKPSIKVELKNSISETLKDSKTTYGVFAIKVLISKTVVSK